MTTSLGCGLLGCGISERLQGVVEHGHRWLLDGTPSAPAPPPPEPAAWWASPWLLALGLVLVAVLVALAVRRSPRLQVLVHAAVAAARLQAQPAAVARWGGPLGRAALAVVAGAWRFVRAGHGARSKALRAVAVLVAAALVVGSPLGAGGFLLGAVAAATGVPAWLVLLALVAILVAVVVASRDEHADGAAWWSERRLVAALVAAGVLPTVREGEPRHVLRRRGAPQHDAHGTTVTVELPSQPWRLVRDRADRLAAALRIDAERLVVEHPEGTPAGVVRLWVGTGVALPAAVPPLASAERTRWTEPVRLGTDARGRAVHLATTGVHTALAGASGSGKTTAARLLVAHALLDPDTRVYVIDGKADAADWSDAAPSCAGFVGSITDDTPERVAAIFAEVLGIVRERAAASAGRGRKPWPGVLLVVEEWAAVRSHAATVLDRAGLDRLDRSMATLLATARSSGVHVVVLAQRLTVDNLPSTQRANVAQRVVMRCLSPEDYAAALGCSPTGATPSRKGVALVVNDDEAQALVTVDHLTDEAWSTLCARAAAARSYVVPEPTEPARSPFARPVEDEAPEPEPVPDPLVSAVLGVLRDSDPRGLPASAILQRLPEWLAPDTPAALGRALRGHPALQRGHVGKAPVWRLAQPSAPSGAPLGAPSADPRRTLGPRATEGSQAAVHAQPGAAVGEPSAGAP